MNLEWKKRLDFSIGGFLLIVLKPCAYVVGRLLRRDHSSTPKGDIAVLKLVGGGSLILALPALLGIKRNYPDRKLILLTTSAVVPFARLLGVFDEIACFSDGSFFQMLTTLPAAFSRVFRADTVIDLEVYSRLSSVVSALTLARNRCTFFLETVFWRRNLHTHLVFFNRFSNVCLFYEKMAEAIGARAALYSECQMLFQIRWKRARSSSSSQCIAMGFSCSENGRERMLTAEQWAELISRELSKPVQFVFLGSASEADEIDSAIKTLKALHPQHSFESLAGKLNLEESVQVIADADAFWGIDSSLLHIARLLAKPCLSVWGPTNPATRLMNQPLPQEKILYNPTPCSPCIHVAERPPCEGRNVCMQRHFATPIRSGGLENYIPMVGPDDKKNRSA